MFFKSNNVEKIEHVKTKDLMEKFNVTSKKLYEIFNLLRWVVKSDKRGWLATEFGVNQGASQRTLRGTDYVVWNSEIYKNFELINAINGFKEIKKATGVLNTSIKMTAKEKKEKGNIYESFIAKHYKMQGYTIAEHGKDNGVKDCGIDIIAKKGKEMLFIQCKNWNPQGSRQVKDSDIMKTRQQSSDYVDDNPVYEMYHKKVLYIMSENVLHGSAYHYKQKYYDKVEFKIIPMIT